MYRLFIFISLLCSTLHAVAQTSEADFQLLQKDYVLNADGSMDMHCRQVLRYNTHISFNRLYGETFIVYNPEWQKLTINESYTIQADGKRINAPSNAFNEVLPRFAADAPDYNQLREMVVTHTGLELGATSYLDYTLHSKAGFTPELDQCLLLQEASPIKEYKVTVTVPSGKQLAYQLHLAKGEPSTSTKDGTSRYEWTFRNIAASDKELYQPSDNRNMPHLIFSTWASQESAHQWLLQQFVQGNTNDFSKFLDKNNQNNSNAYLPAVRAYDYVVNQTGYTPVPLTYSGYRMRTAEEVFRSAYGTASEKALLLLSAMAHNHISAKLVAVYPSFVNGKVGSLSAITDFAVQINEKGQTLVLSPTRFTPYSLTATQANYRYVALQGGATVANQASNSAKLTMSIEVKPERIETQSELNLAGAFNPLLALWLNEGKAKMLLTAGNTDKATFNPLTLDQELAATLNGQLNATLNNGYNTIQLPEVVGGANSWGMQFLPSIRRSELELPFPVKETYSYTINLPEGTQAINLPKTINKANKMGNVSIVVERTSPRQLKLTRTLELVQSIVEPANYAQFAELMRLWMDDNYRTVVYK